MGLWQKVKEKYWEIYQKQKASMNDFLLKTPEAEKKLDDEIARDKQIEELNKKLKEGA
jgi:hypothetical protein